jgi:hypothetical protein
MIVAPAESLPDNNAIDSVVVDGSDKKNQLRYV